MLRDTIKRRFSGMNKLPLHDLSGRNRRINNSLQIPETSTGDFTYHYQQSQIAITYVIRRNSGCSLDGARRCAHCAWASPP